MARYFASVILYFDLPGGTQERQTEFQLESDVPITIDMIQGEVAARADDLISPIFSPLPERLEPPQAYRWEVESVFSI